MSIDDIDFSNDFDMALKDIFTSRDYTDDVNGLLEDDDLSLVKRKSVTSSIDLDDEIEITTSHSSSFDPSEFADDGSDLLSDDDDEVKPINKPNMVNKPIGQYKNKMEHCRAIYARELAKGFSKRAHFVSLFVSEAGCTTAGASTYYATIKK